MTPKETLIGIDKDKLIEIVMQQERDNTELTLKLHDAKIRIHALESQISREKEVILCVLSEAG